MGADGGVVRSGTKTVEFCLGFGALGLSWMLRSVPHQDQPVSSSQNMRIPWRGKRGRHSPLTTQASCQLVFVQKLASL